MGRNRPIQISSTTNRKSTQTYTTAQAHSFPKKYTLKNTSSSQPLGLVQNESNSRAKKNFNRNEVSSQESKNSKPGTRVHAGGRFLHGSPMNRTSHSHLKEKSTHKERNHHSFCREITPWNSSGSSQYSPSERSHHKASERRCRSPSERRCHSPSERCHSLFEKIRRGPSEKRGHSASERRPYRPSERGRHSHSEEWTQSL